MFQPSVPDSPDITSEIAAASIKSIIELIRMKEQYGSASYGHPELELTQLLLSKVVEDSCNWVSNSVETDKYMT